MPTSSLFRVWLFNASRCFSSKARRLSTMLPRFLLNLMTLKWKRWPMTVLFRRISRLRTGRKSTWLPGRNALTLMSTVRPSLTRAEATFSEATVFGRLGVLVVASIFAGVLGDSGRSGRTGLAVAKRDPRKTRPKGAHPCRAFVVALKLFSARPGSRGELPSVEIRPGNPQLFHGSPHRPLLQVSRPPIRHNRGQSGRRIAPLAVRAAGASRHLDAAQRAQASSDLGVLQGCVTRPSNQIGDCAGSTVMAGMGLPRSS